MNTNMFYNHLISSYGQKAGYVDYETLSKCFPTIEANSVVRDWWEWEEVNGTLFDSESQCYKEIYEFLIIPEDGFNILKKYTDEIVLYNETLGLYVWCITFFGIPWESALTSISINSL